MDLLVKNLENHQLFIDANVDAVDICVLSRDEEQYDFTLTHQEWEVVCNYVKQKSTFVKAE